jgi:acetyl esterase/lipase
MLRRIAGLLLGVLALAGCSPLGAFNSVVPKDSGSGLVAQGVAYGQDPRQRLDVYRPDGEGVRPVVVFFYGGSWDSGRREDYRFAAQAIAAGGFVTVVPDYRLYPQVRFPGFVDDGAAAVAYARRHAAEWGGDPDRVLLVGHSAGAYIVAMLALDGGRLLRTGVPRSAIRGWAGLSGPYDFYPFDVPASQRTFGDWPNPEATQPINFAGRGDPPAFLATGTADETVRPRNSEALAARLRRAGVPVVLKHYEGLSHTDTLLALSRPLRGRGPVLDDMVAFLRERSD